MNGKSTTNLVSQTPRSSRTSRERTLGMANGKESLGVPQICTGMARMVGPTKDPVTPPTPPDPPSPTTPTTPTGKSDHKSATSKSDCGISKATSAAIKADPSVDRALLIMRDQLLQSRFHQRMDHSDNNLKHFYVVANGSYSSTESTVILNNVPQDAAGADTNNERLGNDIRMSRLKIRCVLNMISTAASSVQIQMPMVRVVIWREFIPLVPGTPPTVFATDANPPASATALFTRLGSAATSGYANIIAMRNPITHTIYHIYHDEIINFQTPNYALSTAAPTVQILGGLAHRLEKDIDLHDITQNYSGTGANTFLDNCIHITFIASDATNQGWAAGYYLASDLVFTDGGTLS